MNRNELYFVEYSIDNFLMVLKRFAEKGNNNFLLCGDAGDANNFIDRAQKRGYTGLNFLIFGHEASISKSAGTLKSKIKDIDAVFIFLKDPIRLSKVLIQFEQFDNCIICAPITAHYYKNRPVLINSVPKSGTHMLFELMKVFNYKEARNLDLPMYTDDIEPLTFYNLQHMTRDYISLPYPQIQKFVSYFCNSVVLFMFRDPRDIAVSLARYIYSFKEHHILSQYFAELSPEERISAIIKGEYPVPFYINRNLSFSGNIRDFMLLYSDWVKYPFSNTIYLKYEELVGKKGGGTLSAQIGCIWRMQLALHIPGKPADYAPRIYNKKSKTFSKGKIGSFREEFTKEHYRLFQNLPQDFMDLYGYGKNLKTTHSIKYEHFEGVIPFKANKEILQPILYQKGYRGFNITLYNGKYYALSQAIGNIDLAQESKVNLKRYQEQEKCIIANSLDEAKQLIEQLLYKSLQKNISERDKRIGTLQSEISQRDGSISRLNKDIDEISKRIESLQKNISERDERIGALQSDISARDESIKVLNGEISQRDGSISRLNKDVDEISKRIESLQKDISERDERIGILQSEISARDRSINKLNADIEELNKTIVGVRTDVSAKDENIIMLSADIDKCNKTIDSLRSDISASNEDIAKLKAAVEKRNNSIDSLRAAVSERDESIEALNNEISKRDENTAKLNAEVAEMSNYVKDLIEEMADIKSRWYFRLFK